MAYPGIFHRGVLVSTAPSDGSVQIDPSSFSGTDLTIDFLYFERRTLTPGNIPPGRIPQDSICSTYFANTM